MTESDARLATAAPPPMKRGLVLDKVVLLGRTFQEYSRFFGFSAGELAGKRILDAAGGVSSFCAEARAAGLEARAADPIYAWPPERIQRHCEADLEQVVRAVAPLTVYRWAFYRTPERLREIRRTAYRTFLADFTARPEGRYCAASLPALPFADGEFDLTLSSYFLFVYEDQLSPAFHVAAVAELMRVTRGELRIYPLVTFEAEPSRYLETVRNAPALASCRFEIVPTDFEFLLNSNAYLRVTRGR